jgi:putative ABC transport system permease protein
MNVVSRGMRNAFRSPLRTGAIVLMLAISIGLILSMLVARSSVNNKINEVKATAGTSVTISPAGVMGFAGGGVMRSPAIN